MTTATKQVVVRLSDLDPNQRRLILALIAAKRAADRRKAAS